MVGLRKRTAGALAALVVMLVVVGGLAVTSGLTSKASALTAPTPTCPTGTTFDAASGSCTAPAVANCPAGLTDSGGTCTGVACPGGFAIGPELGFPEPGCFFPDTLDFRGQSDFPPCPPGTVFGGLTHFGGPDSAGTCTVAATYSCPVGTLTGVICIVPAGAACPAGTELRDIPRVGPACVPLGGTAGPATANGGDGGSARGGDGGRGGDGTAPQCNQNSSDVDNFDAPPSVSCGAGGRGGEAGDGGLSEGGDGGVAFSAD